MLISFRCSNYKTFENDGILCLTQGKTIRHPTHISEIKPGILKHAVIYGTNASGKSSLISAMKYSQNMICYPHDLNTNMIYDDDFICSVGPQEMNYCRINPDNKDKISSFEYIFFTNGVYFDYGFDTILSRGKIVSEWLYQLDEELKPVECVYTAREIGGGMMPTFGSKFSRYAIDNLEDNMWEDESDWQPNSLFLSNLEQYPMVDRYLLSVKKWFEEKLLIDLDYNYNNPRHLIGNRYFKKNIFTKDSYSNALSSIGVENTSTYWETITPSREFIDAFNRVLYGGNSDTESVNILLSFGNSNLRYPDNHHRELLVKSVVSAVYALGRVEIKNNPRQLYKFDIYDSLLNYAKIFKLNLIIQSVKYHYVNNTCMLVSASFITQVKMTHEGTSESFDMEEESNGTRAVARIAPLLLNDQFDDVTMVFDEFGSSIHPMVLENLVKEFQKKNALRHNQLICVTHNINLLTQNLFRKDEFWFVDKKDGRSELFSLDEFEIKPDKIFSREYMEGRFGALPVFRE